MATLTIDPTEQQDGEFSAEELDSLQVGEALQQQQEQLLAGKFKDAEDLEQAYLELQKKLGSPEEREAEPEPEVDEDPQDQVDIDFLDRLWEESQTEFSDETLAKLEKMDPAEIAQMYLNFRERTEQEPAINQLSSEDVTQLQNVVGGPDAYAQMMTWAQDALSDQEIAMYDQVMDNGDPASCFFAIQALAGRYRDLAGYDGQMLTGKAPTSQVQGFRSQAELVRAMSDPRYDNDPAYRADVAAKLEVSDLNF